MDDQMELNEQIDPTKLDDTKRVHVIDNETGFCSICNKFENPTLVKKSYVKCGEIKVNSGKITDPTKQKSEDEEIEKPPKDADVISNNSIFEQKVYQQNRINNKTITNVLCDIFKGRMCCKSCSLCDSICYVPVWCFILLGLFLLCCAAGLVVSAIYYADLKRTDLKSYAESCSVNSDCDQRKGLYCRTKIASGMDYCNCPAFSTANMCDCASSSYYWNGIKCTNVYGYDEGPCSGNYSCTAGLICDRTTLKCICPPTTPSWNSLTKTCDYLYLGCFYNCLNQTKCDITGSFILTSNNYAIDLDVCLLHCSIYNARYAIFVYISSYRCACTNTYKNYSKQASDIECSIPCSYSNPVGVGRCPYTDELIIRTARLCGSNNN